MTLGSRSVDPDPVRQVITRRTLETSAASFVGLLILERMLPPEQFRRVLRLSGPVVTLGLSAYFATTFRASTRFPGDRFVRRLPIAPGGRQVALTFDDGPHPETTPRLLDALAATSAVSPGGTKATFFVVAERVRKYPDLVRRIVDEGHAIGIHGLSHRTIALDTSSRIKRDLADATSIVEDALGDSLSQRLFRPPYGFKSWTLARTTACLGWTTVGWSCDPRDYDGISSYRIAGRLRSGLRPGDIVLLHERPGFFETIDALPAIAFHCAEGNLQCVKLAL